MASVTPAVPAAVPSALSQDWLTVDTTAAQRGAGPAAYGGGEPVTRQVPGPSTASPVTAPPVTAPAGTGRLANAATVDAAYPHLPPPNGSFGFVFRWLQRQHGTRQGVAESVTPAQRAEVAGAWGDSEPLQTYDQVSNSYTPNGMTNNVPNNRVSARRTFGHSNPLDNPTWMGYQENPVRTPLAMSAAGFTAYENPDVGGYSFSDGGLPDLWVPEGSSVAYEPPAPPASADASTVSQAGADPAAGWA